MDTDQLQALIKKVDDLQKQVQQLEQKLASTEIKLKRKWRADIKKEIDVYNRNSWGSDGDEIEYVQYSD